MITGIGHTAYRVSDLEQSVDFYTRLGFKEAFRLHGDGGELWLVYLQINEGTFIELFPGGRGGQDYGSVQSGYMHLCLAVDDIFRTLEELAGKGITITGAPEQGKDGNWQYWIKDPDGNPIELMQIMPDSLQVRNSQF